MRRIFFAVATAGLLAAGSALADATDDHRIGNSVPGSFVAVQYRGEYGRIASINEREARINARIQRSLNDGSLTRREARRLYGQLRGIEAKERAFRSDGRLDGRETTVLNRDLDRLALNLRDERRDQDWRF